MTTRAFSTRAPLYPGRFTSLPAGCIRAEGSLRDRLLSLRAGLLDRCGSLFPDSGSGSRWFGGNAGGGVFAPRLLEARLLTAAALGDEELMRQALLSCRLVLQGQHPDGSFGPEGESFAARGSMLRALSAAYSVTGNKEILLFFLRYFKFLRSSLQESPLTPDDALHTADTISAGVAFYNVTGQKAVLPVLETLLSQSAPYTQLFHTFPYRMSVHRMVTADDLRSGLMQEDENGYLHGLLRTADGANLCEGLRLSGLAGVLTGSAKHTSAPEAGLVRMLKSHGAASGGLTADPLLAGRHPSRGVTLQSVSQLADSFGTLFSCSGGEHLADFWETLVYNAAAASLAPDGKSVQPVQQANQVCCSASERFRLLPSTCNLFGLDDGDALTSFLPIFPRFLRAQWMLSADGGLASMGYAPCRVRYRLDQVLVQLDVRSAYPEDGRIHIGISLEQPAAFPLHLRIPSWAADASAAVGGSVYQAEAGSFLSINREWHNGDEVLLNLPMQVELAPQYHEAVSVARGPLRFVYAPEYRQERDESGNPVLRAEEGFAVALNRDPMPEAVQTADGLALRARVTPLPDWGMKGGSCDQPPIDLPRTPADSRETLLVPMEKAPIRLGVLPLL